MPDKQRTKEIIRTATGLLLAAAAAAVLILAPLRAKRSEAVFFPKESREAVTTDAPAQAHAPGGTVDPNTADIEELCSLPGVGETIARLIIDEREANGPYRYPEDLMIVRGIGPAKLAGFLDLLDLSE